MSSLQFLEDIASVLNSPLASAQGSFTTNDLNNLATQMGLFVTGNNISTTDPSVKLGTASTQLTTASTSIQTAGTHLGTSSTQLTSASTTLVNAGTSISTGSTNLSQAAVQLNTSAVALVAAVPALNALAASVAPGSTTPSAPKPSSAGASHGPTLQSFSFDGAPILPGNYWDLVAAATAKAQASGTTVNLSITGNTITSQAAADQLAKTIIDMLRNTAGLKL